MKKVYELKITVVITDEAELYVAAKAAMIGEMHLPNEHDEGTHPMTEAEFEAERSEADDPVLADLFHALPFRLPGAEIDNVEGGPADAETARSMSSPYDCAPA